MPAPNACSLGYISRDLTSVCNNAGGIESISIYGKPADQASTSEWSDNFAVNRERSSVEDKYTFDPATGVSLWTTRVTIDIVYSSYNANVLDQLANNAEIEGIRWNSSNGDDKLYTSWGGATRVGSAYVVEGTLNPGQKPEDGCKITFIIEIKSSVGPSYSTTAPNSEEAIPESE